MFSDPMQLARLAALEGALAALLHNARHDGSFDEPDQITAELADDGLSVTYWRSGVPVSGEGA